MYSAVYKHCFQSRVFRDFVSPMRCARKPIVKICRNTSDQGDQSSVKCPLAVTGAWRGTNRQRLYGELGWESLYQRRWYRRLCHFFNLRKTQAPIYLFDEIPPERPVAYNLRHQREYEPMAARTVRFSNTYFQNVLSEWHLYFILYISYLNFLLVGK